MIGHLLYGYVSVEHGMPSLDPNKCEFIESSPEQEQEQEQEIVLYFISSYSIIPKPRSIIILTMLDILRKNTSINSVCINCHNQDGFNIYDKMTTTEVIKKGEEVEFGGIKLFGKRYRYVQILVNIESILASKIVTDLIPFTCKYIENLLQEQKLKNDS